MQPNRLGRILGVGTRVAAEKLREGSIRAAAAVERPPSSALVQPKSASTTTSATSPRPGVPSPAAVAQGSRRFARGAGRFGASLWKPFAHASGILWLQITGLFFAFFFLGFAAHSWQIYRAAGWADRHLPLYLVFAALFAWFAVTSFWRANRKQKRS
jgi:hypothetical protein